MSSERAGRRAPADLPFRGIRRSEVDARVLLGESRSPGNSLLPFPKAHELLDEEGRPTGDRPGRAADRFFDELDWYAKALRTARAEATPY